MGCFQLEASLASQQLEMYQSHFSMVYLKYCIFLTMLAGLALDLSGTKDRTAHLCSGFSPLSLDRSTVSSPDRSRSLMLNHTSNWTCLEFQNLEKV